MCCDGKQSCGCGNKKVELDSDQLVNEIIKLAKDIGLDVVSLENAQQALPERKIEQDTDSTIDGGKLTPISSMEQSINSISIAKGFYL